MKRTKGTERKRKLHLLKKAKFIEDPRCSGCGKYALHISDLDYSHIAGTGSYPSDEMVLDPDNAVLDCRHCHRVWEYGDLHTKKSLLNFKERVDYLKRKAPRTYHLKFEE